MIKSMTAFSSVEQTNKGASLSWEIRTVNHRYLDVSVYLPEGFSSQEKSIKEAIRRKLGRGKADAKLVYKQLGDKAQTEVCLNEDRIKSLLEAQRTIETLSKKEIDISLIEILNWPGVIDDVQDNLSHYFNAVKNLLEKALDELIKTREEEGKRLCSLILSRCNKVSKIVESVRLRHVEVLQSLREKIIKKISEIDVNADTNRLEQELVYQARRLDVDEELDRLDSHIEEVKAVLLRDEPVGRRLDFLMQEFNREANTLGSKSNDAETTKAVVELKVLIEQMREQVMNIE